VSSISQRLKIAAYLPLLPSLIVNSICNKKLEFARILATPPFFYGHAAIAIPRSILRFGFSRGPLPVSPTTLACPRKGATPLFLDRRHPLCHITERRKSVACHGRATGDATKPSTTCSDGQTLDVAGTKVPFKRAEGEKTITFHVVPDTSGVEVLGNGARLRYVGVGHIVRRYYECAS